MTRDTSKSNIDPKVASGGSATAVNHKSEASSDNSTAYGAGAVASAPNTSAFGANSKALVIGGTA